MSNRYKLYRPVFVAIASTLFVVASAKAQDFERYRPKLPTGRGQNNAELPEAPEAAEGNARVLVEQWRAIVFIDHKDKLIKDGLEADGTQVLGDLPVLQYGGAEAIANKYLGGEVSLLRINQMVREVILLYRKNNQPVVDVSVPEQKISNGVVQVIVTESRVGKVCVTGPCFFKPGVLLRQAYTRPGCRIYESVLNDDLNWLSRNPYRNVDVELSPGDAPGTTDVEFKIDDRRPWRLYTGYEDTGTRQTGIERTIYGASWSNAFQKDHLLGYQFAASSDFQRLTAHSLVYEIPLLNRDRLQFYGSYAEINGTPLGFFGTSGIAWQTAGRYFHTLPSRCDTFRHSLVSGVDFKRTNTNLEFGGTQIFNSNADILQFVLGYHGAKQTFSGPLQWRLDFVYGPSGISGVNNNAAYQTIRNNAEADYFYGRAFVEHSTPLPFCLNFVTRFNAQVADGNLLPSEQIGFGGYYSVRGYDMRVVNGDSGYVTNLELVTDPFRYGSCCQHTIQYLTFYDFGDSYNHTLLPGEDPSVDLSSVGIGLRYSYADNVTLRADYAWQTAQIAALPNPRERIHLGAVVSW